jgi:hypothetical protein
LLAGTVDGLSGVAAVLFLGLLLGVSNSCSSCEAIFGLSLLVVEFRLAFALCDFTLAPLQSNV